MALERNDVVTSDNCTSRARIQIGTRRKILGTSSGAAFFGAVYLILVEGLSLRPSVSSFCEVREHFDPQGIFPENHLRDLF